MHYVGPSCVVLCDGALWSANWGVRCPFVPRGVWLGRGPHLWVNVTSAEEGLFGPGYSDGILLWWSPSARLWVSSRNPSISRRDVRVILERSRLPVLVRAALLEKLSDDRLLLFEVMES